MSLRGLLSAALLLCVFIEANGAFKPQLSIDTVVNSPQFLPLFAETLTNQGVLSALLG